MIETTIPVIAIARSQKEAIVHFEIFNTHDDQLQERFLYTIRDYIVNPDGSQYELSKSKPIEMSYAQRDGLKQYVLSQFTFPEVMSESFINNAIKPYALLYYIQTDLLENGKCIFGLLPNQFKISE
jgi:hypothetical protein